MTFGLPRCDSHRNCVWLTRLTRASNRFDLLARSIRSNLPQCFTAGAMRRIDLACCLTETVAELVSSRFTFKASGPAPQLQLLFSRSVPSLSWQMKASLCLVFMVEKQMKMKEQTEHAYLLRRRPPPPGCRRHHLQHTRNEKAVEN